MREWFKLNFTQFLIATALSVLACIFLLSPWGVSLEQLFYDSLFLFRGVRQTSQQIVIVAIDESSFDELDQQWPWPRSLHAKLIDSLSQAGAKVIAFDLLFSEPAQHDAELAQAIDRHRSVVMVNEISNVLDPLHGFSMEKVVNPNSIIELSKSKPALGFANMRLDGDGFVRGLDLKQGDQVAFSLQIAQNYLGHKIEIDNKNELINFLGPRGSISTISYYQALEPATYLPQDFLKGKIVIVGFAVASQADVNSNTADAYPIPFSHFHNPIMPGVEIHANAVENFLNKSFLQGIPRNKQLYCGLIMGIIIGTLIFRVKPIFGSLLYFSIFLVVTVSTLFLFSAKNILISWPSIILPLSICYLGSPVFLYLATRKEKAYIKKAFSTYLSPRLVNELIRSPERLVLGGEDREATVLFVDLAGFTSLSEKLSAQELISFVNKYLGAFAEEILRYDGMIDKYIGDCIMAVWGVPIYDREHATKACRAVLQMKEKLKELNTISLNLKDISFRAGISSGQMLAGNVGGGTQFNYTVLGNEVNLASRLEALNKYYGTTILISERTKSLITENIILREIDIVQVKGQKKAEILFEVCGQRKELTKNFLESIDYFNSARVEYLKKNWAIALSLFEKTLGLIPEDGPAKVLANRCRLYLCQPPAEDWNGVHVMTEK